jgi:5-methyltetrahydrofolate--homocysteine methyltransferase
MLDRIIQQKMLKAHGVFALYPALSKEDDILVYEDLSLKNEIASFHFLRQQNVREEYNYFLSLSDFIAPADSGRTDYLGFFVVTAGIGIEPWVQYFEKQQDDYSAILLKSLADRFAEAFAEYLHEQVRINYWGYEPSENLDINEILREKYQGIRPAVGYPACPEHSEKRILFDLLKAEKNAGISLTENYAMYPAASVSGFYFANPQSRYFNLGKISKDQVEDYSKRKNITIQLAEKLLNMNLAY